MTDTFQNIRSAFFIESRLHRIAFKAVGRVYAFLSALIARLCCDSRQFPFRPGHGSARSAAAAGNGERTTQRGWPAALEVVITVVDAVAGKLAQGIRFWSCGRSTVTRAHVKTTTARLAGHKWAVFGFSGTGLTAFSCEEPAQAVADPGMEFLRETHKRTPPA